MNRGGKARRGELLLAFAHAVSLLTRIPVPVAAREEPDLLGRSTVAFPIVGALVGVLAAAAFAGAARLWREPVPAWCAVAAGILVTGALHEDGLADVADAFGAGGDRDRTLAVLRDPRIGAFGGLALVVAVVGKVAALSTLSWQSAASALVCAHVLARWSSVALLYALPAARPGPGAGARYAGTVDTGRLGAASALALGMVAAASGFDVLRAGAAAGVAGLTTWALGRVFRRRIGGITGDCLGAGSQVVELVTLLLWAAAR